MSSFLLTLNNSGSFILISYVFEQILYNVFFVLICVAHTIHTMFIVYIEICLSIFVLSYTKNYYIRVYITSAGVKVN